MKNLLEKIWENPWILFTIILSLIVVGLGFPVFLEKFGATAGVLLSLVVVGLVWATYLIRSKLFSRIEKVDQKDQSGESKEMNKININQSRLWVGIALVIVAVLMFVVFRETYSTAGAVAIGILGLVSIAISRRKA